MNSRPETVLGSTERIQKLRQTYFANLKPILCHEKALATTLAYQETEGEPLLIRRAMAFKKTCETKTILIQDDELIVGNAGCRPRAGIVCPEIAWQWIDEELDTLSERPQDPFLVTEETKIILRNEVFPYWRGKSLNEIFLAQLSPEQHRIMVDIPIIDLSNKSISGPGEFAPGYENIILPKGLNGVKKEAEEHIKRLDPAKEKDSRKIDFLKAVSICCDSLITLGRRYAQEALRLKEIEKSTRRKAELLKIAEVCEWVPGNPPRNFHEALQILWFTQVGLSIESSSPSYSPARFDQYMFPYFQRDIDKGILTKIQAQELIECLWIKMSENIWLQSKDSAKFFAGYMPFQNLSVGGMDIHGKDATNELSYMSIDASLNTRLFQPSLAARIHKNSPDKFLDKVCELIKSGTGFPACHNDHVTIQMLLNKGVSLEDARNYAMVGCVEPNAAGGKMAQWSDGGHYSFGCAVEFALSDGYHHMSKQYLGLRTGNPLTFDIFDQFRDAVKRQAAYLIKETASGVAAMEEAHEKTLPLPFASATVKDCVERGMDMTIGGARYNAGPALLGIGIADVSNSLAAVKKLVYEERAIRMEELVKAIEADFEGYEPLRQMLLNRAPKYGNDEDYVDAFAVEMADFVAQEIKKYRGRKGCPLISALYPVSSHVPMGKVVWALPSGRKAGQPMADGVSPNQGTDVKGPTAAAKSVAKFDHSKHTAGTLYNMKFTPDAVKGERGTKNLGNLIRGFFDLGGFHIQFNVIDTKTLRAAQKNPIEYRFLLVRVAGYSAYFVELCREIQEEIISRTEHRQL
ncbi:MAG TPA: glycyl radical protein [Thermodesulfobacteriota bacterium]|nr:glycyl radical protein [Thermodesulfobacteriota bacterium]